MDLYDAAVYFDGIVVKDSYLGTTLFTGQMDSYAYATRDSLTGYRRTISAAQITLPPRMTVLIEGVHYICGRIISEYFRDRKIREHVVMHPSDGLFTYGTAKQFILNSGTATLHGATAMKKEGKWEGQTSQYFALYDFYYAAPEAMDRDRIIKGPDGSYYRTQAIERNTSGISNAVVNDMGKTALTTITYYKAGEYDPVSDTTTSASAQSITAFVERWQANYEYVRWVAEKFQNGDAVATVSETVVADPKENDRILANGEYYRVLATKPDGAGAQELHLRPADFNLSVET